MSDRTPKYYPQTYDVMLHFAQNVGDDLGGEYANREIVQGLADFMQVIAETLANNLNRKHAAEFDNRID